MNTTSIAFAPPSTPPSLTPFSVLGHLVLELGKPQGEKPGDGTNLDLSSGLLPR
jgi:hypothetical protein